MNLHVYDVVTQQTETVQPVDSARNIQCNID